MLKGEGFQTSFTVDEDGTRFFTLVLRMSEEEESLGVDLHEEGVDVLLSEILRWKTKQNEWHKSKEGGNEP